MLHIGYTGQREREKGGGTASESLHCAFPEKERARQSEQVKQVYD